MSTNQIQSQLLRLPAELRDQIYQYTFEGDIFDVDKPRLKKPHRRNTIGLLLSCEQIHDEAIELYYKHTTFFFVDWNEGTDWLKERPYRYIDLISDLRFDTVERGYRRYNLRGYGGEHMAQSLVGFIFNLEYGVRGRVELRPGVLKASVLLRTERSIGPATLRSSIGINRISSVVCIVSIMR